MLGVVRLHANANYDSGEYAILVRSDLKGRGLGWLLMQTIIEYARSRRPARHRRPGAARQHHHARDVPRARLRCAGQIQAIQVYVLSDYPSACRDHNLNRARRPSKPLHGLHGPTRVTQVPSPARVRP